MNNHVRAFVTERKYECILACIILLQVLFYAVHVAEYKSIAEGNAPWSDTFYTGEIQYYGYILPAMEAGVVKLSGLAVDTVFVYTSILFFIIGSICWFLLGKEFFEDKKYALMTAVASMVFILYNLKFHYAASTIFFPLFLYFWIRFEKHNKLIDGALTGLMMGITCLVYGGFLIPLATLFFGVILITFIKELRVKKLFTQAASYIKKYYLATTVFALTMLTYFLPLIIKYQLTIVNNVPYWGDISPKTMGVMWFFGVLKGFFFNYASIPLFIISMITLVGFIGLFVTKKTTQKNILLYGILINLVLIIHHWITLPLFNTYFWPSKMLVVQNLVPLVFVLGIRIIIGLLREEQKDLGKWIQWIAIGVLLVVIVNNTYAMKNSQWEMYGKQDNPYMTELYNLANYMDKNIRNDESILSTDESGFMLAVLSGKKVMITRRTHASYYVDIDKRIADASVVLYGHDSNKTKDILKQYNVQYFYMDQQLFQNPMRTHVEFKEYLTENNISYIETVDRYDIAVPYESATVLPMLIIPPQNLSSEFQSLIEPIYPVVVQGQTAGILYRIKQE